MILISHRGNISGKILEEENKPEYVENAIFLGYDVEVDTWVIDGLLWLGHDEPQYQVTMEWLEHRANKLWIHCKNVFALERFSSAKTFNYFWHDKDTATLTSKGFIWVYPGKQPIKESIAVLPEINEDDVSRCKGVCSDYIIKYKIA